MQIHWKEPLCTSNGWLRRSPMAQTSSKREFSDLKFGFIGTGYMARAIATGIITNGVTQAGNIIASDTSKNNLDGFKELNCKTTCNNQEVLGCDVILLFVNPSKVADVLPGLKNFWKDDHTVISMLSGVKIETFYSKYGIPRKVEIIRVIANRPLLVDLGVFAYCLSDKECDHCRDIVRNLFSKFGLCEEVAEDLMDTVSGLCGGGPAYVFTVIQAMSDGGVKMGLPRQQATRMAAQTVMGAAKMVLKSGQHPDVLRDEVCSSSAIQGVHALEKAAVRSAFIDAIEAATVRARELGQTS